MNQVVDAWKTNKVNDLFTEWEIPVNLFAELQRAICLYISKAFHFEYCDDENEFIRRLNERRNDRTNVTPNGGVVPKKEYSIEYNLFIKAWCEIVRTMTASNPEYLKKFRLTPNIRIKFEKELEENVGRGLDTALPHSDAWVEGPWGMNCHVPICGDTENNYLHFYRLRDESEFDDKFLETSAEYTDMQWVVNFYDDDSLVPKRGFVNISDYALIHKTRRKQGAGTRISIDTTIFVGDHDVHPDRRVEYLDKIPRIGEELFISCALSEKQKFSNKKTVFSHYTNETLKHIHL
jgi:hypothetical protein